MNQTLIMIEPKQVRLIHVAKAKLGLSDDEYRAAVSAQTNGKTESSKDMTYREASRLIDYFVTLGFKIPARKKYTKGTATRRFGGRRMPGNVVILPTRDQLNMIDALAGQIKWRFEDGYKRWLKKYMKIDRIKTGYEASDTIEGLKGMLKREG